MASKPDEGLYSRQLYVYGAEAMMKMMTSKVLIIGFNGLAIEIAKNLILSGVNSVTLYCETQNESITFDDLATNYFLNEQDIGRSKVITCIPRLSELNQNVKVSATDNLDGALDYSVVIVANSVLPFSQTIELNESVRGKGNSFIMCDTYGLFGSIFCDFGNSFTVTDQDGEELKEGLVILTNSNEGVVIVTTSEAHNLSTDDFVRFNTNELTESNQIKYVSQTSFSIIGSVKTGTTRFQQVKQSRTMVFKSLEESIKTPEFNYLDMCAPEKSQLIHALYQAKHEFEKKYNKKYTNWSEDASEVIETAKKFYPDLNLDLAKKYANVLSGQLAPITSVIGSLVAQEALKSCSHKYTPIYQWLHFESVVLTESLQCKQLFNLTLREENSSSTSRYNQQISVFGEEFQQKLAKTKVFVVGSGAIGCEHLKNFSMMGIGELVVTDMDTIERSNLSRQFLFRTTDIGKMKSEVACKKAFEMNPSIKITPHQNKVGPDTTNIYNENFFDSLTCVANALDNVDARRYVDSLCVIHKKPLIESGTLGTKCNVQVIVPYLTESYGSTHDPPEKSIPVCTLKNFPNQIEHTIQWARDLFEGYFTNSLQNANKFLENPNFLKSLSSGELIETVKDIRKVLSNIPRDFEACLDFGFKMFLELYRDRIMDLVHKFGPDSVTSSGVPFWSGTKKCPVPLTFKFDNEEHFNFVVSTAYLWADVWGIREISGFSDIVACVAQLKAYDYKPSDEVHVSANDEEEKRHQKELEDNLDVDGLIKSLAAIDLTKLNIQLSQSQSSKNEACVHKIKPLDFEKDDDTNHHIDFITSASNLRALNYSIPVADRFKTKGIAGKIIPAIATTTGLVSGLVALELYKLLVLEGTVNNKVDNYRNWFCNIGLPYLGYSEPVSPAKQKIGTLEITLWDSFEFKKNPTVQEIMDFYESKYQLDLKMLTYGAAMLYGMFMNPTKQVARRSMHIYDIIKEITKKDEVGPVELVLQLSTDEEDEEKIVDGEATCKVYL